jgi:hypothetical protein
LVTRRTTRTAFADVHKNLHTFEAVYGPDDTKFLTM